MAKKISKDSSKYKYLNRDNSDQMVVYTKKFKSTTFEKWLSTVEEKLNYGKKGHTKVEVVNFCGTCDGSLALVVGKGIKTLITTETAKSSPNRAQSGGGLAGEDDGIFFASNVKVKFPKARVKLKTKGLYQPCSSSNSKIKPITVAVFDTGLVRDEFNDFLIQPIRNPCISQATQGWNFTVPNEKFDDDHPAFHGSTVSRFIVDECLKTANGRPVRILPLKVHDKNGNSDLYSVLCGLVYAKKHGAKIINASFGFFAPKRETKTTLIKQGKLQTNVQSKDSKKFKLNPNKKARSLRAFGVRLLETFIREQLTKKGIILVAAAGNKATKTELKKEFRSPFNLPSNPRDLDEVYFYPASFSSELDNVIAVTTVNKAGTEVSDNQNFSAKVVDVGVRADQGKKFGFKNPRTLEGFLYGSSYAAPKLTGLIAANFDAFTKPYNKADIISTLLKMGKLEKKTELKKHIKRGVVL